MDRLPGTPIRDTQFEMLAEINGWNEAEKASFLAVSLRGSALVVLSNLPAEGRRHYATLVAALESRFGSAHQVELNRARLRSRTRRREEGLPELAEDIERLVRLAYPEAQSEMSEVLAKDQFIDALTDEDIRLRIRQSHPKSLRGALETALQLESYQLASKYGILRLSASLYHFWQHRFCMSRKGGTGRGGGGWVHPQGKQHGCIWL